MIRFEDVSRIYGQGEARTAALDGADFEVEGGSFVVVLGPSGAGKSTLLNLLGGMDKATTGSIRIDGLDICALDERGLTRFRAENVGFVFQFYNLIPTLTAYENVDLMRLVKRGCLPAVEALGQVGLGGLLDRFPSQLSGGEQQRVSIARAIAKRPHMLLCDEPTGALDVDTGVRILKLLQGIARARETTVVIVTHNAAIAQAADVVIRVRDGRIESTVRVPAPCDIDEVRW
ncbi:MAG: ABC transporter ATP-binding protein [Coriobacteriales bacterium]|jgi:putative ABC transport system ATP-binding protein|nr:ABC transporter ATP-binding protein [Coriobacteriales bacterium]